MISPTTPTTFVPEAWAPEGGRAESQYVIRELSDVVVIWRPRPPEERNVPLAYVAVLAPVLAIQADPARLRETTELLHAALDSDVCRFSGGGLDIQFDTLDDLRARLAWDVVKRALWKDKERMWAEYHIAMLRWDLASLSPATS